MSPAASDDEVAAILAALASREPAPAPRPRPAAWTLAGRLDEPPLEAVRAYAAGRIDRV